MTIARSKQVNPEEPAWYHTISRCVRRARLCGFDPETGESFEHRKYWIRNRLADLERVFAADVAAYGIMDNHLHLVVHMDPILASEWPREEVARRWLELHPRRDGYGRAIPVDEMAIARLAEDEELVEQRRKQLADLSTFMRELNEWVARHSNREDGVSGRFWQGRFRCQKLLDPAALLMCCIYVDLNPIRAGIASTPEESHFTSIHARIQERRGEPVPNAPRLMPIEKSPEQDWRRDRRCDGLFAMTREQYIALVDWTGRSVREGKPGAIPNDLAPILERLEIDTNQWCREMTGLTRRIGTAIGRAADLAAEAARRGTQRVVSALKIPIRAEPATV